MAKYDDMNIPLVTAVGIVSVLAVIGSIIGLQALYNRFQRSELERKVIAVEAVEAKNLLAEQEATLNRSGWLDREQGIIAIPINRAMQLVVEELRAEQQHRQRHGDPKRKVDFVR